MARRLSRLPAFVVLTAAILTASLPSQHTLAAPDAGASKEAVAELAAFFRSGSTGFDRVHTGPFANTPLTASDAKKAEGILWKAYSADLRQKRANEMKQRKITVDGAVMPFFYRVYGRAPKQGRSLYISMHGGGGAASRVNDQQWENQKRLYQPAEGVYVAPRAPSDKWNLWHRAPVGRMFDRLVENMIVFEGVDPNRVYVMGYSAGGDGTYQLAPRMADRWAAAAMMAGHPGDATPLNLRNIGFALQVGGRDAAYNRNKIAANWGKRLATLARQDPGGYKHFVKVYPNKGHWMDREDAVALPWMAKFTREPYPENVVWQQDNILRSDFYWLSVEKPQQKKGNLIRAKRDGGSFQVTTKGVDKLTIRLNDTMAPLDEEIVVTLNGKEAYRGVPERTIASLAESLALRGDPKMMFSAKAACEAN